MSDLALRENWIEEARQSPPSLGHRSGPVLGGKDIAAALLCGLHLGLVYDT